MEKLKRYIYSQIAAKQLSAHDAKILLKEIHDYNQSNNLKNKDVAIIGIACKFPGANNPEEFWNMLERGDGYIRYFPKNRRKDTDIFYPSRLRKPELYRPGGYLDEIDLFDAAFFRISPKEAELMDPAQRLFLETAWEVIEDAGVAGNEILKSRTGVYIGKDTTESSPYQKLIFESNPLKTTGFNTSILASRISYFLDLKGPSMVVDTACSGSMIALHLAYQAVINGEVDMALAGGVALSLLPVGVGMLESSDGFLWAFGKNASGTVWGEGVAAVLLKPLDKALQDKDNIYAVIKGSAINNDGASNGITAPSAEAQADVIQQAWKYAGIDPETIQYIEAHGTGTKIGDPIEIKGLNLAFQQFTKKRQFCGIGTVKTNIGHPVSAAGIASVIKMVLALKNNKIPKNLNFLEPNPLINFIDSPVYLNDNLTQWEPGDIPRRCGINSFGFSGTNGHMVLEEAPLTKRETMDEKKKYVFTISAKTESALRNLLIKYQKFFKQFNQLHIGDICYTVNTGRGCYQYRIAIIINDLQELIEKIAKISSDSFNNLDKNIHGIYFGCYNVTQNQIDKDSGQLSKSEPINLSHIAKEKINALLKNFGQYESILNEICQLFVDGAEVQWEAIYDKGLYQTVSLPTYCFERKRYWIEITNLQEKQNVINRFDGGNYFRALNTPLLDKCIAKTLNEAVYVTQFSPTHQWVLVEDTIVDSYLIPPTTYLEMAIGAGTDYFLNKVTTLKNIKFGSLAVFRKVTEVEVQTVIHDSKNENKFEIFYFQDNIQFVPGQIKSKMLATGEFQFDEDRPEKFYNLDDLRSQLTPQRVENWEKTARFAYRVQWRNIKAIYNRETETLVEYDWLPEFNTDTNQYIMNLDILDMATTGILLQSNSSAFFTPESIGEIEIRTSISNRCYSYIKSSPSITSTTDTITYDVVILDENGRLLVNIKDYTLKRINSFAQSFQDALYRRPIYNNTKWIPEVLNENIENISGSIIILNDSKGIGEKIAAVFKDEGHTVITVENGDSFQRIEPDKYVLNDSLEAYEKFLAEIKSRSNISLVIHLQSIIGEAEIESLEQLDQHLKRGVFSLFYLIKALYNSKLMNDLEIALITELANEVTKTESSINPLQASLIGLGLPISQEYFNIKCRSIDIDEQTSITDIIQELKTPKDYYKTAYRNGNRYVEILDHFDIAEQDREEIRIKDQGVYIITGGMGGIGLEICKYLASQNKVNLALINRSKIPPRSEWDSIIDFSSDRRLSTKLRQIKEIEHMGSRVDFYSADVANYESMKTIIEELRKKHGKINGIIHSAGIPGTTFLITKSEEAFNKIIAPKIQGTWILDQITKDDELDFFVLFSSVAVFLGGLGTGEYCAGNSFLDSFAVYRYKKGKKTLSINWPAWNETGMALEAGTNINSIFYVISNGQALYSFAEVLSRKIPRIIIAEVNYYDQSILVNRYGIKPSKTIRMNIERRAPKIKDKAEYESSIQDSIIKITGKESTQLTETEKKLAQIWGDTLGLQQINVYDDFYQMGGDSILAIRIINYVTKNLHKRASFNDLLEHSTVIKFAQYLDEQYMIPDNLTDKTPVPTGTNESECALSHFQQSIWLLQKYNPALTSYNVPNKIYIYQKLDVNKFQIAVNKLVERHSILRTVIKEKDGLPQQIILKDLAVDVTMVDLTSEGNNEEILNEMLREKNQMVLDISKPLERIWLYKLEENKFCVYLNLHHIFIDGWAALILCKELSEIYNASMSGLKPDLKPLKLSFADWVRQQQSWLDSNNAEEVKNYWLNELTGPLPVLNIPLDLPRPAKQTFNGSHVYFKLGTGDTSNLKRVSRELNATLHIVFLSAYVLLLKKITRQKDIIIGVPFAQRDIPEWDNVMGPLLNMLCVRVNLDQAVTFKELVNHVKTKSLAAYQNGRYPFDLLVEKVNPERDPSRNPIYSTTFQFFDVIPYYKDAVQTDLDLYLTETNHEFEVLIMYNTDLFKKNTIERMKQDFLFILKSIVENSRVDINDIELEKFVKEGKAIVDKIEFKF